MGVALSLRDRPGADRPDDRELPIGPPLEADAAVPLRHRGAPPGELLQRLALTSGSGRVCGRRGIRASPPRPLDREETISGWRPPSDGRASRSSDTSWHILS